MVGRGTAAVGQDLHMASACFTSLLFMLASVHTVVSATLTELHTESMCAAYHFSKNSSNVCHITVSHLLTMYGVQGHGKTWLNGM